MQHLQKTGGWRESPTTQHFPEASGAEAPLAKEHSSRLPGKSQLPLLAACAASDRAKRPRHTVSPDTRFRSTGTIAQSLSPSYNYAAVLQTRPPRTRKF